MITDLVVAVSIGLAVQLAYAHGRTVRRFRLAWRIKEVILRRLRPRTSLAGKSPGATQAVGPGDNASRCGQPLFP